MRALALTLMLACLALAGWTGHRLWQRVSQPPAAALSLTAAMPATEATPATGGTISRNWPALFGTAAAPEPQPPAPPAPPMPPIESLGYRLKGVVSAGTAHWAILAHPTGDVILKPGDTLTDGITVEAIDEQGLWLSRGGERVLLGFDPPEG